MSLKVTSLPAISSGSVDDLDVLYLVDVSAGIAGSSKITIANMKIVFGITTALLALGTVTPAANKIPYFTGASTASTRSIGAASSTDILDRAAGDGRYVLGAAIANTQIAFGTGSAITGSANLIYDTSAVVYDKVVKVTGSGSAGYQVNDGTRSWAIGSTSGVLQIYDVTGSTSRLTINSSGVLAVTGSQTITTTLTIGSLTSGRVTFAGTSGLLQDSANFLWGSNTLTITGNAAISGTLSSGATSISVLTVTGLTSGRVPYVSTGGLIVDSATLTFAPGLLTVGNATSTAFLVINRATGNTGRLKFYTGGLDRWNLTVNAAAEAGASAGSDFSISAFNDAGTLIDSPIGITRAAGGAISLGRPVTLTGTMTISTLTSGRIPFASTSGLLIDHASLIFSANSLTVGDATTTAFLTVNKAAGNGGQIRFRTGGLDRWIIASNGATESGSDVGSTFVITSYTDAGVVIDTPFTIVRAAGGAIILGRPTNITGTLTISTLTSGRVPVAGSNGLLTDSVGLTYAASVLTVGDATTSAFILMNRAAGTSGRIKIYTSGLDRWNLTVNAVSESGSNAGSDFSISAFNDAGTLIDSPFGIIRAAGGAISLGRPVSITGNLTVSTLTSGRIPFASTSGLLIDSASLLFAANSLTVGDATTTSILTLNKATGNSNRVKFQTAGLDRWQIISNATAESGSDAGSDFILAAFSDVGVTLGNPITITRAAGGTISLARPVSITGNLTVSTLTSGRIPYASTGGLLVNSSKLTFDGVGLRVGDGIGLSYIVVNGAAGSSRYATSMMTNGVERWQILTDSSSESGSNAGSNFYIAAFTDGGSVIDYPFSIIRAAGGAITLARPVSVTSTTDASAVGTASVITTGGLGVAKRSYLGTIGSTFAGNVIAGVQNATAAVAGQVGEVIVTNFSSVALASTGTTGNIASIALTPGDWLITASCVLQSGATGFTNNTNLSVSIVTTSATAGTLGTTMSSMAVLTLLANSYFALNAPVVKVNISTTTTYYFTANGTYGGGSPVAYGTISATRIR